ncbi:hypothetical protein DMH27_08630 [Raoultella planticola]|nr:hypothetical protein [Raoultella planticola]
MLIKRCHQPKRRDVRKCYEQLKMRKFGRTQAAFTLRDFTGAVAAGCSLAPSAAASEVSAVELSS